MGCMYVLYSTVLRTCTMLHKRSALPEGTTRTPYSASGVPAIGDQPQPTSHEKKKKKKKTQAHFYSLLLSSSPLESRTH